MTSPFDINTLTTFLDNLTDIDKIPTSLNNQVSIYIKHIAKTKSLKDKSNKICLDIFEKWENHKKSVNSEAVYRCQDLWYAIHGKYYELKESLTSNMIIERSDVATLFEENDFESDQRLEFDPITKEVVKNPMSNLVIEEVEVNDYI